MGFLRYGLHRGSRACGQERLASIVAQHEGSFHGRLQLLRRCSCNEHGDPYREHGMILRGRVAHERTS